MAAVIDTPYMTEEQEEQEEVPMMQNHNSPVPSQTQPSQTESSHTQHQGDPPQRRRQADPSQTLPLPSQDVPGSLPVRQTAAPFFHTDQQFADNYTIWQSSGNYFPTDPTDQPYGGHFHPGQPSVSFVPAYQHQFPGAFTEHGPSAQSFQGDQQNAGTFYTGQPLKSNNYTHSVCQNLSIPHLLTEFKQMLMLAFIFLSQRKLLLWIYSFIPGQPSAGYIPATQPAGFFTRNQPRRGQISGRSVKTANIANTANVAADEICAAFIGREPNYEPSADVLTVGKLSLPSLPTGPSSAGRITAGELHVDSIGPGRTSADSTEQDLSGPPQVKGKDY